MLNYQKFKQFYDNLRKNFDEHGIDGENVIPHLDKEYYKQIGIEDPEKIKLIEYRKVKEMHSRISLGLPNAHFFEIDEKIKRLLLLTDAPHDKEVLAKLRLPFENCFIETQIDGMDADIDEDSIQGILIMEAPIINRANEHLGQGFVAYYMCYDKNNTYMEELLFNYDKIEGLKFNYNSNKSLKVIKNFLINFILFLESPEVEYVEFKRSQKNREKRIKEGKMPLPNTNIVRVTGKLKLYLDHLGTHLTSGYNISFWVRGHWRKLNSERYKNHKTGVIFIEPFIKGEGILVDKTYKLNKERNDERVKELEKNYLFLDDIEPAKKPLRELK